MTLTASQLASRRFIMPGTFSVTYYVLQSDGTFAAGASVPNVEKRPLVNDRIAGGLQQRQDQAEFRLWAADMDGVLPKPGDKFTDPDDVQWIVMQPGGTAHLLEQRWHVSCERAASED